jgi:hypothetical protein
LPGNNRHTATYRHTECWEGFIKYAVEIILGAILYIPNFIKTGSGFRSYTACIEITLAYLHCSQNKRSRLRMKTQRGTMRVKLQQTCSSPSLY